MTPEETQNAALFQALTAKMTAWLEPVISRHLGLTRQVDDHQFQVWFHGFDVPVDVLLMPYAVPRVLMFKPDTGERGVVMHMRLGGEWEFMRETLPEDEDAKPREFAPLTEDSFTAELAALLLLPGL